MEIKILEYTEELRGAKQGWCDLKVIHSPDKSETFRKIAYFKKDGKSWLAEPNLNRNDIWMPFYEREPSYKKAIFPEALKALEAYLEAKGQPQATEPGTNLF